MNNYLKDDDEKDRLRRGDVREHPVDLPGETDEGAVDYHADGAHHLHRRLEDQF